ncbi:site-specific integrase [Pseudorhodoferax sp. Leaf265]|uniref:site-specific integrase n=1 Tax=Pseudorhodoferax sp. Leaf265 TaxID=1736315 RepID=UPI0006FEBFF4|nr:site-specific integrase [Pseudorhodoferax sp. Leaf265]KQP16221.1 hypothetical protein ASF45_06685 [Pseudorhodoferax sp. Leaf265]
MSARPAVFDQIHDQVLARFIGPMAQPVQIEDEADLAAFLGFFQDLQQPGLEDFHEVMLERVATRGIKTVSPALTVRDDADRALFIQMARGVSQPGFEQLKAAMLARLRGAPLLEPDPRRPHGADDSALGCEPAASRAAPVGHGIEAPVPGQLHRLVDEPDVRATAPASVDQRSLTGGAENAPLRADTHAGAHASVRVNSHPPSPRPDAVAPASRIAEEEDAETGRRAGVENPTRWPDAVDGYVATLRAQKAIGKKTLRERRTLLDQLGNFLVGTYSFSGRFFVHQVQKHHIAAFADFSANRLARGITKAEHDAATASGKPLPTIAPRTQLKRNSTLALFFDWALNELQATSSDPTSGMEKRNSTLKKQKSETSEPYRPFERNHITTIFDPDRFLAHCRVPDYFWAPLLGIHLGARLGELVNVELCNIKRHELSDIWYIDLQAEDTKNQNSVRRLPITRPLVDLGFLDYVEHIRGLGATTLFPHRDMTTKTARDQPSKNASDNFAKHLDACGLSDPALVFHSFRHTVITALQLANVPLLISQQIAGHAAQDHAVRTGAMTREQARSVTMTTYSHADIPSMTMEDPFRVLKQTLEQNLTLPLDYVRLARAAAIVQEHVRKSGVGIEAGWPAQNRAYTQMMLARLN